MLGSLIGAAATIGGGLINAHSQAKQMAMQKQFAQQGIQWRAADAAKAGISKLYALGANTTSYAPVSVGGGTGDAVSAAGQNIGRAIDATASPLGRAGVLATEIASTQLEGLKIDNDIKRADLLSRTALRAQPGQPPAILNADTVPLVPGQGNAAIGRRGGRNSGVQVGRQLTYSEGGQPHRSVGVNPEVDFWRTSQGYAPEVPETLGEAQESQPLSAAQWFIRNKIMPTFSTARQTYPYPAPPGSHWQFNPLFGEYTLRKGDRLDWLTLMKGLRK